MKELPWKLIAVSAVLAMAVSLLSGGLGGVPLSLLMVRMVIAGSMFAVLALLVHILMVRLFPELFAAAVEQSGIDTADSSGGTNESLGSRLNIVMPASEPDKAVFGSAGEDATVSDMAGQEESGVVDGLNDLSGGYSAVDSNVSSRSKEGPMGDTEPEEIARAIHTVLKRDEKG